MSIHNGDVNRDFDAVNGQNIEGLALAVCGVRPDQLEPGGTCFLLAQGVAVTARHVIDDIDAKFQLAAQKAGRNERDYSIQVALQEVNPNVLFEVEHVYICAMSDIAILNVRALTEDAFNYPVRTPSLNFWPPAIGEEIFGFGYSRQSVSVTDDGRLKWTGTKLAAEGAVTQVFPENRDNILYFPSFETNADFKGHMSGGPVVNNRGEVVGIISRGWEFGEVGPAVSYGAALWPMLSTNVRIPREGREEGEEYPFFDLLRDGNLPGANWNHPQFDRRSDLFRSQVPVAAGWTPHPEEN